jgi:CDGSH-type Zn-finger protein
MARIVELSETGPFKLDPANFPRDAEGNLKPISICQCGISSKMPLCDGSHKVCREEEPGMVYAYDAVTKAVLRKEPKL